MSLSSSLAFFLGNEHRRKSPDSGPGADMVPLAEAAAKALAMMRRKKYALAAVAGLNRSEDEAIAWVAENMIGIVAVYERSGEAWQRAAKGPIAGRVLAVPPASIKAYLKWARNTY